MNVNFIKIFLAAIILGFGSAQASAQVCTPAPIGLVAAWSGDGDAVDARSRNNGTIQGNVTYAAGNVGQAFNLGGGNGDRVLVGNPVNLQLVDSTIEAWIKRSSSGVVTNSPNPGSPGGIIFAYGQGGYAFLIDQNTNKLGLSQVGSSQILTPNFTITDTNWHHVAVTRSGPAFTAGTQTIFYLDGAADTPTGYAPPFTFTTNAAIGSRGDGQTDNVFFGTIDELAIYDRALSAAQIQAIFNSGTAGKCKPLATTAPDNQVLWLAGDGDGRDSSGDGNNGTLPGGSVFTVGKVGQAFQFDGTVQSQIIVPDSQSLRPTTAVTVDAWINPSSAGTGFQGVLFKGNTGSAGGQPYSLFVGGVNHQVVVRVGNDSTFDALGSVGGLPANVYSHVAFTYDGATIRIYINGALDSSAASSIGNLAQIDTNVLRIGGLGSSFAYTGAADEIGIYNRALSLAEIQSISNSGLAGKYKVQSTVPSGAAGWYPGDGNANDIQAGNTGTLQGSATYANGKVGQAFSLNGTNAYVSAPSTAANDPTGAGTGASMEAWFYLNQLPSAAGHPMFIVSKSGTSGTDLFELRIDPDDRIKFLFRAGGVDANIIVQTGVWYHVVGTFDLTSGTASIYINGVLANVGATGGARTISVVPLDIGYSSALGGNRFFNGLIDEPAIFNRTLTANEIRDIYYAQSGGKYKAAANPTVSNKVKTGDIDLTFSSVTQSGAVSETPLSLSSLPALPAGAVSVGLTYDIATSAVYSGQTTVCFKLPALSAAQFANLGILHLESGFWIDRAVAKNTAARSICASTLTLSPFAVAQVLSPTSASVSVGGRVLLGKGSGIANARLTLTGANGEAKTVLSNQFGYYRFDGVSVGETYILSVGSKRFQFEQPTQVLTITDDMSDVNFTASP
jgi:hypothetical protein